MGAYCLAPYFEEVVGVDISQQNIYWAKAHLRNEDLFYMCKQLNELSSIGTFEAAILIDNDKKFGDIKTYIKCLNYVFEKNLINGGKLLFDYTTENREELKNTFMVHYLEEYPEENLMVITKEFSNRLKGVHL
jgi:hypothetical protein